MDPEKKKLVSKVAFLVSVFLLLLIDFASLGLTGANFMVWSQLATDEKRQNTSYASKHSPN